MPKVGFFMSKERSSPTAMTVFKEPVSPVVFLHRASRVSVRIQRFQVESIAQVRVPRRGVRLIGLESTLRLLLLPIAKADIIGINISGLN